MQPYKVLIVDDIDNNRFTLDIMLSVLGDFDIDEAESGPQALQMLSKSTYDLVLLDIMMPGMTGIEVLEELDIISSESTTKFIVVSALQDMDTIVKALELGALDFLPKPIEETLLAARIKQLLERRETEEQLRQNRLRIDSDLKKAADIQKSLCPTLPLKVSNSSGETSGETSVELVGTMQPAYEVGGDFYDYFQLDNEDVVMVIADACGKGTPAAIYASRVHDLLRMAARNAANDCSGDTSDTVTINSSHDTSTAAHNNKADKVLSMTTAINEILCENNDACWFVTAWVGIYTPSSNVLCWCSAGHCDALLKHADGKLETLSGNVGAPLGLDDRFQIETNSQVLEPGSTLHLYTDGLTEHRNEDGAFLNEDGLANIINQLSQENLAQADYVNAIAEAVNTLNPLQLPEDDITLMTMCVSKSD